MVIDLAIFIIQTCPCNKDPLTPHLYIVKLGFTGVPFFFLLWNLDCGYSLEPPNVLTCTHDLCFEQKKRNKSHFSSENYHFYIREILQYIARTCLCNVPDILNLIWHNERRIWNSKNAIFPRLTSKQYVTNPRKRHLANNVTGCNWLTLTLFHPMARSR